MYDPSGGNGSNRGRGKCRAGQAPGCGPDVNFNIKWTMPGAGGSGHHWTSQGRAGQGRTAMRRACHPWASSTGSYAEAGAGTHVPCTTHVLWRRGAAAAVGIEETSGPSSQLGGETLYWSFGKMGAPLYRQVGHGLVQHMQSIQAGSPGRPRLGQDVGGQGGSYASQRCHSRASLWTLSGQLAASC